MFRKEAELPCGVSNHVEVALRGVARLDGLLATLQGFDMRCLPVAADRLAQGFSVAFRVLRRLVLEPRFFLGDL